MTLDLHVTLEDNEGVIREDEETVKLCKCVKKPVQQQLFDAFQIFFILKLYPEKCTFVYGDVDIYFRVIILRHIACLNNICPLYKDEYYYYGLFSPYVDWYK